MKKITQQDIADALNVSRVTVSKAINNIGNITPEMKQKVIKKAKDLGYKKIPMEHILENEESSTEINKNDGRNIVSLMTYIDCATDAYWSSVISGMATVLGEPGYDLSLCFLTIQDDFEFKYPNNFDKKNTCGILLLGQFTVAHIEKIKENNIPIVSIDSTCEDESEIYSDTILTFNQAPIRRIVEHLIFSGHKKIGYMGQYNVSLTFKERFLGYVSAMEEFNMPIDYDLTFLIDKKEHINTLHIKNFLDNLKEIPSAFICANDKTAIILLQCLKEKGIDIPNEVCITGFDNLYESGVLDITTVNVPKVHLGMRAAEEIIWRIKNPDCPFEIIRINVNVIFRKSSSLKNI